MAVSIGAMFVVVMPATMVRYSIKAVGIAPMGRGCWLGSPLGYARSCMALAEGYAGEPRGGSFDKLFISLGGRADCQGRYTTRCFIGLRLGRGGSNAKLRSREVLCSGDRCHSEGCFKGGELQVQPRFQAIESSRAGEGDMSVLSFAGGANK